MIGSWGRAAGLAAALFLALAAEDAAAAASGGDARGCRDLPGVPRFAGSAILACDSKPFDELAIPAAPLQLSAAGAWEPAEVERVEGKVTRILYVAPPGHGALEVYRNYADALARLGAEPIFECAGAACGSTSAGMDPFLYAPPRRLKGNPAAEVAFNVLSESRYLAARVRPKGGGDGPATTISLLVGFETGSPIAATQNRTLVLLESVELKAMEDRMVVVPAERMADAIAGEGRFASYGILFDFDSAAIKPESEPTLAEIGKLLASDPALKLYVVGHTDDAGGHDHNLKLSRARAKAVVDALAARHKVPSARLRAEGVGPLAPVASNASDEGRARNRRVELVKQK